MRSLQLARISSSSSSISWRKLDAWWVDAIGLFSLRGRFQLVGRSEQPERPPLARRKLVKLNHVTRLRARACAPRNKQKLCTDVVNIEALGSL